MKNVTSAKLSVKDDWVEAAMTDNQIVVELLIRLKHADAVVSENHTVSLPTFKWGVRQRRSRSSRFGGRGDVLVSLKKGFDSVRGSPKTPLSWSGGSGSGGVSTSPSAATVDGFEDTSRQTSCSTSTGTGSKVFPTSEITSCFYNKLNKKKSSSELKDEENLKLKERLVLKKEIESLRATFDEQHVRNQRLKRIKLDLNSSHVKNETTIDSIPKSCRGEENQRSFYFLPDLNMVPSEDDIICGTS